MASAGFFGRDLRFTAFVSFSPSGHFSFFRGPEPDEIRNIFHFVVPRLPRGPQGRFHSDCVVSWDTAGGIQAFGCPQGPLQPGFGVAEDGPVEVLAVLQGKFCLVAWTGCLGT